MAWYDGILSMFESFKSVAGNNINNSNTDTTAHNAPNHSTHINPDDFIDSSWSGMNMKF